MSFSFLDFKFNKTNYVKGVVLMNELSHKGKMFVFPLLIGLIILCSAMLIMGFDLVLLKLILLVLSVFKNVSTTGNSDPYIVANLYILLYGIPAIILNYLFINYWANNKLPSFIAHFIPKYHSELLGKTLDIFTLFITLILFLYKNSDVSLAPNTYNSLLLSIYPFNLSYKLYQYVPLLSHHVEAKESKSIPSNSSDITQ